MSKTGFSLVSASVCSNNLTNLFVDAALLVAVLNPFECELKEKHPYNQQLKSTKYSFNFFFHCTLAFGLIMFRSVFDVCILVFSFFYKLLRTQCRRINNKIDEIQSNAGHCALHIWCVYKQKNYKFVDACEWTHWRRFHSPSRFPPVHMCIYLLYCVTRYDAAFKIFIPSWI